MAYIQDDKFFKYPTINLPHFYHRQKGLLPLAISPWKTHGEVENL